jgi:hypothetical protein
MEVVGDKFTVSNKGFWQWYITLRIIKIDSIQCDLIVPFITPLHVSIHLDHHQRGFFPYQYNRETNGCTVMLFTLFYIQYVVIIYTPINPSARAFKNRYSVASGGNIS